MTRRVAALAAALAALPVAGCSGSSSPTAGSAPTPTPVVTTGAASAGATTPSTPTTSLPPPPTSAAPTTSASPGTCTTAQLRLRLGDTGVAAGNHYTPVIVTNRGATTCLLRGYPGVSFLDASGAQLGPAAARVSGADPSIALRPGRSGTATLHTIVTGVYTDAQCRPATPARMRVFPPGQTEALFVPYTATVCTTDTGRAEISPFQPGADAQP